MTLPSTTQTVVAGATPTVVTVTGPEKVVEPPDTATRRTVVTVTTPSRTIREPPQVVVAREPRLIVVTFHAKTCLSGTKAFHGGCSHVAYGNG